MIPYTPESVSKILISPETFVALCVVVVLLILTFVIFIKAKKQDPMKPSKGILFLVEWAVEKLDGFVAGTMGKGFENFAGILLGIIPLTFICFTIGITGLPTPMNSLAVPLSLALITFSLIHFTSMRYTKWQYFKRYVDPIPVFLPINLLSMWAPLLSMTLRMFGNALVGWVLLGLINNALENASMALFGAIGQAGSLFFVPIATPLLHAYFDLFSGFIQTLVFVFLTCLFIAQEKPDDIEEETVMVSRKEAVN